jgi:hypothetical protein
VAHGVRLGALRPQPDGWSDRDHWHEPLPRLRYQSGHRTTRRQVSRRGTGGGRIGNYSNQHYAREVLGVTSMPAGADRPLKPHAQMTALRRCLASCPGTRSARRRSNQTLRHPARRNTDFFGTSVGAADGTDSPDHPFEAICWSERWATRSRSSRSGSSCPQRSSP